MARGAPVAAEDLQRVGVRVLRAPAAHVLEHAAPERDLPDCDGARERGQLVEETQGGLARPDGVDPARVAGPRSACAWIGVPASGVMILVGGLLIALSTSSTSSVPRSVSTIGDGRLFPSL